MAQNNNNKQKKQVVVGKPEVETPEVEVVEEVTVEETPEVTEEPVKEETPVEQPKEAKESKKEDKQHKKEEVKLTESKSEPEVKTTEVEVVVDEEVDCEFKVGDKVKLKRDVYHTVTGADIPTYAHKNTYTVKKILPKRIIIGVGAVIFAVSENDIVRV